MNFFKSTPLNRCILLLAVFALGNAIYLNAQCLRVGKVEAIAPGCGAIITDLVEGRSYRIVEDYDKLSGGQVFAFESKAALAQAQCPNDGLLPVGLTCFSEILPISADFSFAQEQPNPLGYYFDATVYDETKQKCTWDFGDGGKAYGKNTIHQFRDIGQYKVCLKVTDIWGKSVEKCQIVSVGAKENKCGFDLEATAVGKRIYARLRPLDFTSIHKVSNVSWRINGKEQTVQTPFGLNADLPSYGAYSVCVNYEVENAGGAFCVNTLCKRVEVTEVTCETPAMADPELLCPVLPVRVCGCDNFTYDNECEAMSAGLTSWRQGDCETLTNNCMADYKINVISGSPETGYTVRFHNQSIPNYVFVQIDFGDGSPVWQGNILDTVVTYVYKKGGIYRSNLTVWSPGKCVASMTKLVVTDAWSMTEERKPVYTDYVYPGDANGDRKANVYDVLNLGIGYNIKGSPRPNAHTNWIPQFAANWDQKVSGVVDFKHLDCDGDGEVNNKDIESVHKHFTAIDTSKALEAGAFPQLWLDFADDTITIDPTKPAPLQVKANIMLGSLSKPVLGLYGLAFALRYPDYVDHDPTLVFHDDLFDYNNTLSLKRDIYNRRQYDIGLSKNDQKAVSGYGSLGQITLTTDYIIIVDITSRSNSKVIPFTVPIAGVRGNDNKGNTKGISGKNTQDTVWIKLLEKPLSTLEGSNINDLTSIYPNPASDEAAVYTGELVVERIELRNMLGVLVKTLEPSNSVQTRIALNDLNSGIYVVSIVTDKGVAEKSLSVQR
jgi:PKD repeat protein